MVSSINMYQHQPWSSDGFEERPSTIIQEARHGLGHKVRDLRGPKNVDFYRIYSWLMLAKLVLYTTGTCQFGLWSMAGTEQILLKKCRTCWSGETWWSQTSTYTHTHQYAASGPNGKEMTFEWSTCTVSFFHSIVTNPIVFSCIFQLDFWPTDPWNNGYSEGSWVTMAPSSVPGPFEQALGFRIRGTHVLW